MSAVVDPSKLLASIDAVYASAAHGSEASSDAPSAAQSTAAVPAPAVRGGNPAVAQLDHLEALLTQWMSANDAWRYSHAKPAEQTAAGNSDPGFHSTGPPAVAPPDE